MRIISRLMLALVATLATTSMALAGQTPSEVAVLGEGAANAIEDRYIVVFKEGASASAAQANALATVTAQGGAIHHEYSAALNGFAATLPEAALDALRQNSNIAYIEVDQMASIVGSQ